MPAQPELLAPGKRTVTAALQVIGLGNETQVQNDHRVVNRENMVAPPAQPYAAADAHARVWANGGPAALRTGRPY